MNIGDTLQDWYDAKKKLDILETKIKKYKLDVVKEMNHQGVDKISSNGYTVSRRRNSRSYLTKENVPIAIWKQYSTSSHYDSYYLVRN
jgi:hypothetical protein